MLIDYIARKSEGLRGIREIEDKVRQDVYKPLAGRSMSSPKGNQKLSDVDKIKKRMAEKDLPEHVK